MTRQNETDDRRRVRDVLMNPGGVALTAANQYAAAFDDSEIAAVLALPDPTGPQVRELLFKHADRIAGGRRAAAAKEQDQAKQDKSKADGQSGSETDGQSGSSATPAPKPPAAGPNKPARKKKPAAGK